MVTQNSHPNLKYWWTRTSSCRPAWNYHWVHRFCLIDLGKTFKTWNELADSGVECVQIHLNCHNFHIMKIDVDGGRHQCIKYPKDGISLPTAQLQNSLDNWWTLTNYSSSIWRKLSPQHFSPPSSQFPHPTSISVPDKGGGASNISDTCLCSTPNGFVLFRIKYSVD